MWTLLLAPDIRTDGARDMFEEACRLGHGQDDRYSSAHKDDDESDHDPSGEEPFREDVVREEHGHGYL